jgi:acetyl esterase/lipase
LTALAVRRYQSMRVAIARVPPELRSPLMTLSFPSTVRGLRLVRQPFRLSLPSGNEVSVVERQVDGAAGVRARVTTPTARGTNRPAVLWIHGGGMVVGSPQFESPTTGHLARELNAVVVSPDYRLSPEHSFPAPLDDCMATLRWMRERADDLGIDADRIAVGGASAGGGLAAAVAQRNHDEQIPLRAQVIIYGMLHDRTAFRDDHAGRGRFVVTPSGCVFAWTAYLGREPRMSDAPKYAAPARRSDLTGLPPAWVGVGDLDLLYPENVAYAEELTACGVPCELITVSGMYHGADGMAPKAASMQAFRTGMVEHIRTHL